MAGEVSTARESSVNPINGLAQRARNIPQSELRATNDWLDRVRRTDTIEGVQDIARTAKAIFNQGGVSFESAKAVVDAAQKREEELKKRK